VGVAPLAGGARYDPDVWGPYSLLSKPADSEFHARRRCRIRGTHHAAFLADIGKYVMIEAADQAARIARIHDDRPATVRRTVRGAVTRSDPRCIQTLVGFDVLDPL